MKMESKTGGGFRDHYTMRMRISFSLRLIFRIMLRRPIFPAIRDNAKCRKGGVSSIFNFALDY